jgi:phosphohistidine phosphatase
MASLVQTELYLIRHGIAAERGTYANDDDRPLVEKGHQRTAQVAKRLVDLGCTVDLLLTSPLVRAQQTAEILLQAGFAPQLESLEHLAPGGSIARWLDWLTEWQSTAPQGRLALVGHEPDLSRWGQQLVTGQICDRWELKKAGIIGLQVPEAQAAIAGSSLFWLTPPRLFLSL